MIDSTLEILKVFRIIYTNVFKRIHNNNFVHVYLSVATINKDRKAMVTACVGSTKCW